MVSRSDQVKIHRKPLLTRRGGNRYLQGRLPLSSHRAVPHFPQDGVPLAIHRTVPHYPQDGVRSVVTNARSRSRMPTEPRLPVTNFDFFKIQRQSKFKVTLFNHNRRPLAYGPRSRAAATTKAAYFLAGMSILLDVGTRVQEQSLIMESRHLLSEWTLHVRMWHHWEGH